MDTQQVLMKRRQELSAKVDEITNRLVPHHEKVDKIQQQIDKLKEEQRKIVVERKKVEEELIPARNELAQVARSLGGRSLGENS
jgi:uncharacterized coiled-coil DUF342 family protein